MGPSGGGFRVSREIPMVRLRRGGPLDRESRRRRAFFARHSLLHLSLLLLLSLCISCTAGFGAPTARAALEDVTVMQQAIQHGGDSGAVAQQFPPVLHRAGWP